MLKLIVWSASHGLTVVALQVGTVAAVALAVFLFGAGARRAVLAALAAVGALLVVGEIAMASARTELEAFRTSAHADADVPVAAVIASFTPLRRGAALDACRDALDVRQDADAERLGARTELALTRGDLRGAATLAIEHGSPVLGAFLAERAGAFRLAARGRFAAGDVARASDDWDKGGATTSIDELRTGLVLHLASGALGRAEKAARDLADALRRAPEPAVRARAVSAACLADALAARSGAGAKARRVGEGAPRLSVACACLDADLVEGDERIARLAERPIDGDDAPRDWLELLRAEATPTHEGVPPPSWTSAPTAYAAPDAVLGDSLSAVERGLGDATEGVSAAASVSRGNAALRAGLLAELVGDHDAAQRFETRASADAEELLRLAVLAADSTPPPPEIAALAAEAHSLASLLATVRLDVGAGELTGSCGPDAWWLLAARKGAEGGPPAPPGAGEGWALLASGRWGELAAALHRGVIADGTFLRFADLAARKTPPTDAPALLAELRFGRRLDGASTLPSLLVRARSLADAARGLGDPDAAAPHDLRANGLAKALARRDVAVLLAVAARL